MKKQIITGVITSGVGLYAGFKLGCKVVTRAVLKELETNKDNSVYFESINEANQVSEQLFQLLLDYKCVSVTDLHDLIGKTSSFKNNKIGWTDLTGMRIIGYGNKYILKMPKTVELK